MDHEIAKRSLRWISLACVAICGPVAAARGAESTDASAIHRVVQRHAPRLVAIRVDRERERSGLQDKSLLESVANVERENLKRYYRRPDGHVSGLLLDTDGHVLTSLYNVAGKIKNVRVTLADGSDLPARVLARDPVDDLALLKLTEAVPESLKLPPLAWKKAADYRPGRFVVAVGLAPDSRDTVTFGTTVTFGIISAPARNGGRAFQTDAALNYGNSGGPLFDLDGEVIGMAAFVGHEFPDWGLNSGIGFGVRADTILRVLPGLKDGTDVTKRVQTFLGIAVDREHEGRGCKISHVSRDSAASQGGVRAGDVLVEFDRVEIDDFPHMRHLIARKKPGDKVLVKIRREDATLDVEIVLGTREI